MKASKLDQYRDFIVEKLKSNVSISQIRRDLENVGCTIARSALNEWIKKRTEAEGMKLPPLKRGRPAKTKPALFSLLPPVDELDAASVTIPLLVFALQEMSPEIARSIRDHALMQLGLPVKAIPTDTENSVLELLTNLSDTDLCLVALLQSDLPAPPLTQGHEELSKWFTELMQCACELRAEIRAATKRKPGDTSLKEAPCA